MFDMATHREMTLRKSRLGHFFRRGTEACGYNALKIQAVYFPASLLPLIDERLPATPGTLMDAAPLGMRSEAIDILRKLCDAHIIVPAAYDEVAYLHKARDTVQWKPRIRVMVLHLTDYCNLRCRYCFIEGTLPRNYPRRKMSPEVARAALDLFGRLTLHKRLTKPPSVVFYGGEPLGNPHALRVSLEHLSDLQFAGALPPAVDKVVITNGTLISKTLAGLLKAHDVMVSVSVDGPQDLHDANRVTPDGRGSFDRVISGIETLRAEGIEPTVSCVLAKENVNSATRIARFILDDLRIKAFGFNHVSIIPNLTQYDASYEKRFGVALIEVQELIQKEFPGVYERRLNHKLNHFLRRNIIRADCTGCGEQMSVSPDGKVGVCQGYMGSRKTFAGNVFDAGYSPEDDPVFVEWSRRSPLSMDGCTDCQALATCGGGCPRNADVLHGTIWAPDSAFCHFARAAQEWMIWKQRDAELASTTVSMPRFSAARSSTAS